MTKEKERRSFGGFIETMVGPRVRQCPRYYGEDRINDPGHRAV